MIRIILIFFFFISNLLMNSQVIILEFDLCQNFEHPSNVSTPFAKQLNIINYVGCYKSDTTMKVVFDVTNKRCEFNGKVFPIVDVFSVGDNTFELIVNFNNQSYSCVLSGSLEGDFVYISETVIGDKIKGWFTLNPKVTKIK